MSSVWSRCASLLDRYLSDPRKFCFIDTERSCGLATRNALTRDYERMTIFGHYSCSGLYLENFDGYGCEIAVLYSEDNGEVRAQ